MIINIKGKNGLLARIASKRFSEESFAKFTKPEHPQYKDYHDRQNEMWHDIGFNNGLETVIMMITNLPYEGIRNYLIRDLKENNDVH